MEGLRTHTAHAAQEDQDSRADELAQEGGDFVQRRSLHFEYLTATEKFGTKTAVATNSPKKEAKADLCDPSKRHLAVRLDSCEFCFCCDMLTEHYCQNNGRLPK